MENILVIGGAGFCGINLAKFYLFKGYNVKLFDNFSGKYSRLNAEWLCASYKNLDIIEGDLCLYPSNQHLDDSIVWSDKVFHFAGQVAVTTSVISPREDFTTNLLGTFNVLESIRNNNPSAIMLYISTNKVYGMLENLDMEIFPYGVNEEFPIDFCTPYACSKGAADQYVRDYNRTYDLKTIVFRQSGIYGNRQFGVEDQGWVSWFVYNCLMGNPITIYGDGNQVRDMLFIDDLVEACDLAISNEKTYGSIYNIGGGVENFISLNQLVDMMSKERKIEIRLSGSRVGDQRVYISDIRKAKRDFNWEPKISVEDGLTRFTYWVDQNKHLF